MSHAGSKRPERKAKPFAEAVPSAPQSLQVHKRQVVRAALSAAAEELFLSRGFEKTTVERIARTAGVSRRTFFRYYESKEDVMVERSDRFGELLLAELAARPRDEPPLVAIRNALVPAVEAGLAERDLLRYIIRLLRETTALRRAMMEHRNRLEERIAALMARRLGAARGDNTPICAPSGVPVTTTSPPACPPSGPRSIHVVGGLDDVEVMLDHQHGVAGVHQAVEAFQQAFDIRQVQPRGRLIEDVERVLRALQLRKLGGDLDALRFAAGERRGRLAERQVAQSQVVQHLDLLADRGLAGEEGDALFHGHVQHMSVMVLPRSVTSSVSLLKRAPLQTRTSLRRPA
jgi:AcrR family transcriptional regulator